jgi:hypothetical protein
VSRLKELEKRLKTEPDNLGLRVMLAGAMREAGRSTEAVELYRSVALAYRDQGRQQQAIAVCRSILEIAPDDPGCQALLGTLVPAVAPARRSSLEETPLPRPVPYHIADPTSAAARVASSEIDSDELPAVEGAKTRPGSEQRPSRTGLAEAARRISGLISERNDDLQIDIADELDTRKVRKIDTDQLRKIAGPPPAFDTGKHVKPDDHEMVTPIPGELTDRQDAVTPVPPGDTEEEMTEPRELPRGTTKT